jgi:hypothetical protein
LPAAGVVYLSRPPLAQADAVVELHTTATLLKHRDQGGGQVTAAAHG